MLLMSDTQNGFGTRLKSVERKHTRLAQGYDCKVGQDGLIVFRPKRRKASFPWRGLVVLIVGFLCFKGLIIAQIGPSLYQERIEKLQQGTVFEQVGAFVMYADPVAQAVAAKIRPLL